MYKLLVQRQYAFPSIAYSAWISRKGATRLIADGEIEDVAHNVGGFAHGLDAVDAHRPAVVVLIEVGYAHILLQISQDASECRRLIVGRVFRRNEKHCHVPLLQHDFLNAETAGKPAQRDHKNQLALGRESLRNGLQVVYRRRRHPPAAPCCRVLGTGVCARSPEARRMPERGFRGRSRWCSRWHIRRWRSLDARRLRCRQIPPSSIQAPPL